MKTIYKFIFCLSFLLVACGGSDILEVLIDTPDRKTIDVSKLGVNNFFNQQGFGSIGAQYSNIANDLNLRFIRVLFAWTDEVQASPTANINFGFFDNIVEAAPGNVSLLVVVTSVPSWMSNSANWIGGNPRLTFIELFLKKVVQRYANQARIEAFQVWNEPNNPSVSDNSLMQVVNSPGNYLEMLQAGYGVIKANSNKLVLNAATTAINQNFPATVDYNRELRDLGAQSFLDVWAMHYYGEQYENVVKDNGVEDFFNGVSKPVWVTESGVQGVLKQLEYGERVWPFLIDEINTIQRIYIYEYAENTTNSDATYGLRNRNSQFSVSDLYRFLAGE